MDVFIQLVINALVTGSIYALAAAGLAFIYATTRVFHLAHGSVVAFGAYLFWFFGFSLGLPLPAAVLLTVVCAGLAGTVMNELVYEPLRRRKAKGFTYIIAALALLIMGNTALLALFGSRTRTVTLPYMSFTWGDAHITSLQILIIISAIIGLGVLGAFVRFTRFGRAMRAVADNEELSTIVGIHPRVIRRATFFLGSALGGIAGSLLLLELSVDSTMGVAIAVKAFTAVVVGGIGSMEGAIIGSILVSFGEQAGAWYLGTTWKDGVAFFLLMLFLLVRPHGLFGKKHYA